LAQATFAVVERRRAPDFVPIIVINDRPTAPPSAGLSSTVSKLGVWDMSRTWKPSFLAYAIGP
jgi:hypothetical protein